MQSQDVDVKPSAVYIPPSLDGVGEFNDDTQGWGWGGHGLQDEFP